MLFSITEIEIYQDALVLKDNFLELRQIDINENSTVLPMFSSKSPVLHVFGYSCLEKRCLHQNSWFGRGGVSNLDMTLYSAVVQLMPSPGELNGNGLNKNHLRYDYYFFNGPSYSNIQSVTLELNLTPVYISDNWKVFK